MIDFSCSDCGARFKAPDDKAGKTAKCPKCGAAIRIPSPGAKQHPPADLAVEAPGHQLPEAPEQGRPVVGRRHPARRRSKPKQPIVAWALAGLAALVVAGIVIGLSVHGSKRDQSQEVVTAPQPTEPVEPSPEPQPEPPQRTYERIYGLPGMGTEHYVLYSSAAPELKADITMRLEHMYTDYSRDMADVFTPSNEKAKVFFIGDQQIYEAAGGEALGTFRGDNDTVGPRLLLRNAGDSVYLEITSLMQHEGWHQFCWSHVRQYAPIWLDEGLAMYYQFGVWTGDTTVYGGLYSVYFDILANSVNSNHLRPFGDFLALSDADWRYWQSIDGFWAPYMQSWSVIQFLKHANGGAHKHLLDAYIADVAAGVDTTASARAIADMQDRWFQWLATLGPTSTHGRFFEAIAAILTGYLARAHLNGQTFESMDAFLAAAESGELELGPIGSDTWLPPSVMDECKRSIEFFRHFYAGYGLGTLELELEHTDGLPGARVRIRDCNIDVRGTAKMAGGRVDVQITHLQPLQHRFE